MTPGIKAGLVALTSIALLATDSPYVVSGIAIAAAAALLSTGGIWQFVRGLRRIVWFLAAVLFVPLFQTGGHVIFQIGPLFATAEGLAEGLLLAARIVVLFALSQWLILSTPLPALVDAFEAFAERLPAALKPSGRVLVTSVMLVPLLVHTARRIKAAQRSRGIEQRWGMMLFSLRAAAGTLIVSAVRSADTMSRAMEAKGYDPSRERTRFGARSDI